MTQIDITGADLPDSAPGNHGRTRAAWVTTGGIAAGALVAAIGVGIVSIPWIGAGAVIVVAALVAGAVLKAVGHGQPHK